MHRIRTRFTAENPPRVYEIAAMAGCQSRDVLAVLTYLGYHYKSASSSVRISHWFAACAFDKEARNAAY